MQRFECQLAGLKDNEQLLEIIERDVMGEAIGLRFKRRPNFFLGIKATSYFNQVLIIRDKISDSIIGCASRSFREVYVNGVKTRIGYLGDLRLNQKYRKKLLLAKGYSFLKELDKDGQVDFYLSTIVDDNFYAKEILTSRKAGLPTYHDLGLYFSYSFQIKKAVKPRLREGMEICGGSLDNLEELISFLNQEGRKKNLFPVLKVSDFNNPVDFLRDFGPADFLILKINGQIAGVMGLWDQHGFKQVVVQGYGQWLKVAGYIIRFFGLKLPEPGTEIKYCSACFLVVRDNNPDIFSYLLRIALYRCQAQGYYYLAVGLHSSDPLNKAISKFKGIKFVSRLYQVFWEQNKKAALRLNENPLYMDVCSL